MASLGFDNYLEDVQAKHEHWHDQPRCEYCGNAIHEFAYHSPDGLLCEACADELLEQYKQEWREDVNDWRDIDD